MRKSFQKLMMKNGAYFIVIALLVALLFKDFKILANVILQNHRNSDMHWIAHFLTFDRVSSENLDDSKPQKANVEDFELVEYFVKQE